MYFVLLTLVTSVIASYAMHLGNRIVLVRKRGAIKEHN